MRARIYNQLEKICINCMPVCEEQKADLFNEIVNLNNFRHNKLTNENAGIYKSMCRHAKDHYKLKRDIYKYTKRMVEVMMKDDR